MTNSLKGVSVYDPSKIEIKIADIKPYGFSSNTKFILSDSFVEFHLQASSSCCSDLLALIGKEVDFEIKYEHRKDDEESWSKSFNNILEKLGSGSGTLNYELSVGSDFPIVKFIVLR